MKVIPLKVPRKGNHLLWSDSKSGVGQAGSQHLCGDSPAQLHFRVAWGFLNVQGFQCCISRVRSETLCLQSPAGNNGIRA